MKKIFYIFAAALLGFGAASCSKVPAEGHVTVHFTVGTGDCDFTKAVADGSSVTQMLVGVYAEDGTSIDGLGKVVTRDASAGFNFDLQLVETLTYKVVLFAQSADRYLNSGSWTSADLKAIDLTGFGFDSEADDAFTASLVVNPSESSSIAVSLARPWAQVNVATSASLDGITKARFEFPGVPAALNALTGEVSGSQDIVLEGAPAGGTYAGDYILVGYAYVPARAVAATITATVKLGDDSGWPRTKTVENLPLQSNRRTNILGEI